MTESQFKKAVEIVKSLPEDGPTKPTADDKLFVRTPAPSRCVRISEPLSSSISTINKVGNFHVMIYAISKTHIATVGDVNIPSPGYFDFVGKEKWLVDLLCQVMISSKSSLI